MMKKNYIVVGGGLSGLMVLDSLKSQGLEVLGLESTDELGHGFHNAPSRLHSETTQKFLQTKLGSQEEWSLVEDTAISKKKGKESTLPDDLDDSEKVLVSAPFFRPNKPHWLLLDQLIDKLKADFHLLKPVFSVDSKTKTLRCEGGEEYQYDHLVWCEDIQLLEKAWEGEKDSLATLFKKRFVSSGAISLEQESTVNPFTNLNTTVLPFRFKAKSLKAFGTCVSFKSAGVELHRIHWLVYLEDKLLENREEVAKVVRTLKREVLKEFTALKNHILQERIVYLPKAFGGRPRPVKELKVLPDVYYVGPQLAPHNSNMDLWSLDRTVENCQIFEKMVLFNHNSDPTQNAVL